MKLRTLVYGLVIIGVISAMWDDITYDTEYNQLNPDTQVITTQ